MHHSFRHKGDETVGENVFLAIHPQLDLSSEIALIRWIRSKEADHLIKIVSVRFHAIYIGSFLKPEALDVESPRDGIFVQPGNVISFTRIGGVALLLVFRKLHFRDYVLTGSALSHDSP